MVEFLAWVWWVGWRRVPPKRKSSVFSDAGLIMIWEFEGLKADFYVVSDSLNVKKKLKKNSFGDW